MAASPGLVSSPLTPPPTSSLTVPSNETTFLATRPLPEELIQHVTTYFEEGLHYQALNLLHSLLAANVGSKIPIDIPPPFHLSFILTLSLHPKFSIHASTPEKLRISVLATTYLSSLLSTTDPISAGFAQAYTFNNHAYMRGGRRRAAQIGSESPEESGIESLESELAQAQGFFQRADDFWAALGWAFTCSVLRPIRWTTWSLWCTHMIDLLEKDWRLRETQNKAQDAGWCKQTLLVQYIGTTSSTQLKRIVRAIFAEGVSYEFSEIWKDETQRKRKKEVGFTKRGTLDIDAGQLADYGDLSSDEENVSVSGDESKTEYTGISTLGPSESLRFRMRMLALLSTLSLMDPQHLTPLHTLYTTYLSHLRPLPLATIHKLLTPQNLTSFSIEAASGLIQFLARSFLESAAPACSLDDLTWDIITRCYVPWASSGSTVGDNGKIGICVEALVGLARRKLGFSPLQGLSVTTAKEQGNELWIAVEKGCQRRQDRAGGNAKRAKKGEAGAEFDFEQARDFEVIFLQGARMRLALLLGMSIR